jgi:hypothetical protein
VPASDRARSVGSVIENASDLTVEQRKAKLLPLVGAGEGDDLAVPESGAWQPTPAGHDRRAQDLVHEAELDLTETLAPSSGGRCAAQPSFLHLLFSGAPIRSKSGCPISCSIVSIGRPPAHETPHHSSCSSNWGSVEKSQAIFDSFE